MIEKSKPNLTKIVLPIKLKTPFYYVRELITLEPPTKPNRTNNLPVNTWTLISSGTLPNLNTI